MDYIGSKSFSVDMTEQELYYKALFEVMKDLDKDWFFGQGWYGWDLIPATGGINDNTLTPRGKPAEDVMRYYYGNGDTKSRIIKIDGKFDDWKPEFLLATDALGDSKTTAYDLKAVYGVRDDMYLYLMVEFEGGLRDIDVIVIPMDFNNDNIPDAPFGAWYAGPWYWGGGDSWLSGIAKDMTWQGSRGMFDIEPDSVRSRFEIKIPYRVMDNSQIIQLIGVQAINNSIPELMDEIEGIIKKPAITGINENNMKDMNDKYFTLSQNYPNPFNPSTTINFSIPKSCNVKITIYNIKGSLVKEILNKKLSAGIHTIKWDGKNKAGLEVSTGIYFYQLKTDTYTKTNKMLKIH